LAEQASSVTDEQVLQSFGYRQELRRALRLFSLYAVAFSIISITTGIFTNFGFGLAHLGPASIWPWLLAGVGQLLVALVISEPGTRMPLAGYSYQWGSRLMNSAYGWFVGFTALCYLSVGGAGITFVVVAPLWATILAGAVRAPAAHQHHLGRAGGQDQQRRGFHRDGRNGRGGADPHHPVRHQADPSGQLLVRHRRRDRRRHHHAASTRRADGIFTIVGFELVADLSEEAINARVTVPRAVIWSVVSAAVLGMVALIGFALAIPDLRRSQPRPFRSPTSSATGWVPA